MNTRPFKDHTMIPYKDEDPRNAALPIMTIAILAINVIVFVVFELPRIGGGTFEQWLMDVVLIPAEVTDGLTAEVALDLLRSMFMHAGISHIAGNMLYLWVFADNVENAMGHLVFLGVYLLSGVAAAAAHVIVAPNSTVPTLGASGAIAGVLGAYLVLFPKNRVMTMVPGRNKARMQEMPALVVLGFWFVLQLVNAVAGLNAVEQGGVAFMAHVGGFVAGAALGLVWKAIGSSPAPARATST
jgi:membrane associated rhomboid family serine protease